MKLKDDQKYDRLIQAAITLLAQGGLANFSTTKVAKQAGIPQSNVYIYFKNKDSLLNAVFQATIHQESVAVVAAIDANAPLLDRLAMSIRGLYHFALAEPAVVTTVQILTEDVAVKQKLSLKRDDQENQQIQTLLTTGIDAGLIRPTELNLIRFFLTRPVFHYAAGIQNGLYPASDQGLDDLVNMLMAAVLLPSAYRDWLAEH
ncbi:TetR/AcrR family transcriptional regulator [Lactiplantibacillus daowaiensis]|uniref:TetR/AcrR family transcriptional regulator n=1 Tax=Lactiplantibacillus daowaiensis TaxID=2559918 RepID=A0ABW1RWP9_9LACO|nr:TetR/AcrR family transcriptional regulator [Lactiplantibacillus daowaiensis]